MHFSGGGGGGGALFWCVFPPHVLRDLVLSRLISHLVQVFPFNDPRLVQYLECCLFLCPVSSMLCAMCVFLPACFGFIKD